MPVGIIALQSKTNLTNVTKTDKLYNERNGADDANILKFSERHILMMSNNDQVPEGIIRYRTKNGDTPGVTDTLSLTETDVLTGNSAVIATKHYVDTVASGLDVKQSVKAATTSAVDFANNELEAGVQIDGYTLQTGDRVLVKDQADPKQNGIYTINATGAPTRATDFITNIEVPSSQSTVPLTENAFTFIENGTLYKNTGWTLSIPSGGTQSGNSNVTIDDTNGDDIIFTQFSGAGLIEARDGIHKTGNILDVERNLQIRNGVINATPIGKVANSTYLNSSTLADLSVSPAEAAFTTCEVNNTLEVTGITTLTSLLNANGGIGCDNNAFTVADTTGNTVMAGTLDLNNTADIADTLTLSKATGTGLNVVSNAIIEGTCAITKALTVNGGTTFLVDPDANGDTLINSRLKISASKNTNTNSEINALNGNLTIDSNSGNLILDGHTGVQIDSTNSGNVEINSIAKIQIGNDDRDENIEIGSDGERTILVGTASGTGGTPSTLINLNAININIDSTASISLDAHDNSNFTVDSAGKNLSLIVSGGGTQKILLDSAGTEDDAIDVNVVGGFDLDAGRITLDSADNISLDSLNDSNFTVTGANKTLLLKTIGGGSTQVINQSDGINNDALKLLASAGGITGTCNNDKSIIFQNSATTTYFKLNSNSSIPASETIELVNNSGTADTSILLDSKSGGLTAIVSDGNNLTLQNTAGDLYFKLAAHSNAAGEDIRIVNTNGTDAKCIELTASAGGITTTCNDNKSIVLQNNSQDTYIKLNANTTASNETIQIHNYHGTDSASIALTANSGGIIAKCHDDKSIILSNTTGNTYIRLNANTTASSETILLVNANGTDESSLKLQSTSGGIDIDASAGKNIDISGGQILLSSKTDEANAIALTTNVGTSETIVVTNSKGTNNSAIYINSVLGGVDIDAEKSITLNSKSDSNFIVNGDGDLTIQTTGNISNKLILNSSGSSSDSIDITCSGGINMDADGGIIAIDASLGINIGQEYATDIDIDCSTFDLNASSAITLDGASITIGAENPSALDLNTTTIDIDSLDSINIDSVNNSINIGSILTDGQTLKLGKNAATEMIFAPHGTASNEKITLTNKSGTDSEAIYINSEAGGIKLNAGSVINLNSVASITIDSSTNSITMGKFLSDGQTLKLGKNGATEMIFAPHGTASNEKITLTNTSGTDSEAIYINSEAGGIKLNAGSTFDLDSAGALTIDSGTSIAIGTNADKPIDIDSTTFDLDASSNININSSADISINSSNGTFNLDSDGALTIDSGTSIAIGTNADKPIDIDSTTFDLDASSNININSSANISINSSIGTFDLDSDGALTIDSGTSIAIGTNVDKPIDINSTTFDLDASSNLNINSSANILINSANGTFDLDSDGALTIDSGTSIAIGTNVDKPIDINSTTFDLDASSNININSSANISINSSNGTFDLDSDGALTIDSGTSIAIGTNVNKPIDIYSTTFNLDASSNITIDNSVGNISINSANGTFDLDSAGALTIDSGTSIAIGTNADKPIDIDSTTFDLDASSNININSSGNISINSLNGTFNLDSSGALTIDSGTSIAIGTNADKPIDINSTTFDLDATGSLNIDTLDTNSGIFIGTATSGVPITIGHSTSEVTVQDNLTVNGNFHVHGTTTQVNSTIVTIDDIILTLGGDAPPATDDGKDRGVEFRYYDGSAKIGFFGYDNNLDLFTYIPDGTNTAEVYSINSGNVGHSLFNKIYFNNDLSKANTHISGDGTNLVITADDTNSNMTFTASNFIVNTTTNIDINSANGYFDLDTSGDITLTSSSGIFDLDSSGALTIDSGTSISIGTNVDKPINIKSTTFNLDASSNITIDNSVGNISINSAAGIFDLDSAGALTIDSATSISIGTNADKPIDIDSTTFDLDASSNININSSADISINSSNGTFNLDSTGALTIDSGTSIAIGTNVDKPIDIDSTTFDLDASSNININSAGNITLNSSNGTFDLDSTGALTVDSATSIAIGTSNDNTNVLIGTSATARTITVGSTSSTKVDINAINIELDSVQGISLDSATDSNFTVTGEAQDLDIAVSGGGTQELRLASAGTGNKAIYLNASAGGIKVDSADMIDINASDEISIDTTSSDGHIAITSAHSAGLAMKISANADAGSILDIDAGILNIDTQSNFSLDSATNSNITVAGNTQDLDIAVSGGGAQELRLTSAGTGNSAIKLNATAGGIDIDSLNNINIDTQASISIDSATDSNITVTGEAQDLDIAVSGGGTQELRLSSAGTGTSAIHLNASAGGINIDSADMIDIDAADEISIDTTSSDGHISITSAHTAGESIKISANADTDSILNIDAGILNIDTQSNFSLDSATNSNITVTGEGQDLDIAVSGGGTQELRLSSAGTGSSAIHLNSSAGGINIDSNSTLDIDASGALTIDSTASINLGTVNSGVAIFIGHTTSETTVNDNLNVTGNLLVNTNDLFVNSGNSKIGINESNPDVGLHVTHTDAIKIAKGTTAQRPDTSSGSANRGYIRYNTTTDQFEGFGAGDAWGSLGGVIDVDQDTYISAENSANSDNDELKFYTHGTQQMIIDSTGLVGINRTPDTGKQLDVSGVTRSTSYLGEWLGDTVATAQGGTGQTTYTPGQLLCGTSTGTLAKHTIKAGSNITVANNDNGEITVAAIAVMPTQGEFMYFTSPPFISNNISSTASFMNLAFMNMDVSFDKYSMQQNVTIDYILLTGSDTHQTASYTVEIYKNGGQIPFNTTTITGVNKVKRQAIGSNLSFSRADELQIKISDTSGNITGEEVLVILEGTYSDIRVGSVFTKSADRLDISYNTGGKVGINNNAPNFTLDVTGTFNASAAATAASFTANSDDRMKHGEINIVNALDTIMQLNPQIYNKTTQFLDENFNDSLDELGISYQKESGFIAQEVFNIAELKHNVLEGDDTKPYGLNYSGIIPYNTKAIQELKEKNDELQTKYDDLETKYNDLLARITALENN